MKNNATQIKKQINRGLSDMQRMFTDAINYDALHEALSDPVASKEITRILKKIKY